MSLSRMRSIPVDRQDRGLDIPPGQVTFVHGVDVAGGPVVDVYYRWIDLNSIDHVLKITLRTTLDFAGEAVASLYEEAVS